MTQGFTYWWAMLSLKRLHLQIVVVFFLAVTTDTFMILSTIAFEAIFSLSCVETLVVLLIFFVKSVSYLCRIFSLFWRILWHL
jgi:hypothetical protein